MFAGQCAKILGLELNPIYSPYYVLWEMGGSTGSDFISVLRVVSNGVNLIHQ